MCVPAHGWDGWHQCHCSHNQPFPQPFQAGAVDSSHLTMDFQFMLIALSMCYRDVPKPVRRGLSLCPTRTWVALCHRGTSIPSHGGIAVGNVGVLQMKGCLQT